MHHRKSAGKKTKFFKKVEKIVAKIPYGKVTTYGDIAEAVGIRSSARTVGWALNGMASEGMPCHRVVNRFGALSGKMHFGDPNLMEDLLRSEGIEFDKEGNVNLKKHLWKPPLNSKSKSRKNESKKNLKPKKA